MPSFPDNLPGTAEFDKVVTILAVSPKEEDHTSLGGIVAHSNWKMYRALACSDAMAFLRKNPVAAVVCERDLPDGDWRNVLEQLSDTGSPQPLLIVTSLHADDNLWAEVLNLGGYDVLSKPFDRMEVIRVLGAAWLHWKQLSLAVKKAKTASAGGSSTGTLAATA